MSLSTCRPKQEPEHASVNAVITIIIVVIVIIISFQRQPLIRVNEWSSFC